MRVRVKRAFIDRNAKEFHRVGEVLSITEERFKEIQSVDAGLLDIVEATKKAGRKRAGTVAPATD